MTARKFRNATIGGPSRVNHTLGKNVIKVVFCEHCDTYLFKMLYFKHKKTYYDRKLKIRRPSRLLPSGEDFELMNEDFEESELPAVVEESTVHRDIEGDKGILYS